MSEEMSLSEQQKQTRVKQLQQQLLLLEENKKEISLNLEETKLSLVELEKGKEKQVVYKRIGRLMFLVDAKITKEEMEKNKKTWESYLAKLELQSKKIIKKYQEIIAPKK
ncbi:MAG: prefoldin subunit [Candidatus Ranarchaeia archaeon]